MDIELREANALITEFEGFDADEGGKFQLLMMQLPPVYELEYFVYSASNSFEEQQRLWDYPYLEIVKRMLFKKFDSYVEKQYLEKK